MKYFYVIISVLLLLPISAVIGQNGTEGVELRNIEEVNGEYEEHSPIPYKDGFIYTSARQKAGIFKPKLYDGTKRYMDLMYAKKGEDGKYTAGSLVDGNINGKWFDGAATFNADATKMYLTRSNLEGKNKQDTIVLKVYEADFGATGWKNEVELPFNSDEWNTAHPTLSKDGNTLFFSSDRPGTLGGMDLWMSQKNSEGKWGAPINLGADVNTANNEIFPHIGYQGNLFFSSDYCPACPEGKDLDIYVANRFGGDTDWAKFGSLGTPFNTSADDVNFVVNETGTAGYFASARTGGKGFDDIYEWTYEPEVIDANIVVIDEDTGERLDMVNINITPTSYGNILDQLYRGVGEGATESFVTPKGGRINYGVLPSSKYDIDVSKEEYFPKELSVTTAELTEKEEYIIPIKREIIKSNLIINVVDASNNAAIPLASIKIQNLTTGDIQTYTADENGQYKIEINCEHEFKITGSKRPYTDNTIDVSGLLERCREGDVTVTVPLSPIMLVHVYFDFDESILRDDDQPELDNLYTILMEFPDYTAELRGHTDSRGSKSYNKTLSQNRAQAVVDWLKEKGINEDRLIAVGLGELELINNCADGIRCTELEHQLNRRTEFKVINKKIQIEEINSSGKKSPRVDPCIGCPH